MPTDGLTFDPELHQYRVRGVVYPSLTTVLKALNFFDYSNLPIYYAERGKAVHAATALHDSGTLDYASLDPQLVPYVVSYQKFLSESGYIVQVAERALYHAELKIAGTLDRRGFFPKRPLRPVYIDIKTGAPERWHGIQLAGYVLLDTGWTRFPHGGWVERFGLYLSDDESYRLVPYNDPADADTVVSAARLYHYHTEFTWKG